MPCILIYVTYLAVTLLTLSVKCVLVFMAFTPCLLQKIQHTTCFRKWLQICVHLFRKHKSILIFHFKDAITGISNVFITQLCKLQKIIALYFGQRNGSTFSCKECNHYQCWRQVEDSVERKIAPNKGQRLSTFQLKQPQVLEYKIITTTSILLLFTLRMQSQMFVKVSFFIKPFITYVAFKPVPTCVDG